MRAVAVVAAQGQEEWKAFTARAAEDGWSPEEVLEGIELAKGVNPSFAKLLLVTPSVENMTDNDAYTNFASTFATRAISWKRGAALTEEQEIVYKTSMSALMGTGPEEIKQEAIMNLVEMGVGAEYLAQNAKPGSLLESLMPLRAAPIEQSEAAWTGTEEEFEALTPEEVSKLDGQPVYVEGLGIQTYTHPVSGPSTTSPTPSEVPMGDEFGPVAPEVKEEVQSVIQGAFSGGRADTVGFVEDLKFNVATALQGATHVRGYFDKANAYASAYVAGLMGQDEFLDQYEDTYAAGEAATQMTAEAVVESWQDWWDGDPKEGAKLEAQLRERLSGKGDGIPAQPWEAFLNARNMDNTVPPEVFGDGVRKPADYQEEAGAFMQVPNTRGENLRTNRVGPAPMGATSAPDRSLQDSQELTEILTNPAIPEDMKNEARAEFERLYGEGAAGLLAEQQIIDAANNPDMEQDERDAVFERAAAEHPDGWKGVRDVLSRLDSGPMAPIEEVTGEPDPAPQTMQRSPHPEVDTSEQDSKDLVMMMEDPNIDQEMLNEAINAFQQKYGPGSAAAAFDMIMNKSQ